MSPTRFVSYLRVSTERQGSSGLGLEAQRDAVSRHLRDGQRQLVAEVTEIESGRRADRPKLADALALCRIHNATLIIAKLDRLARNVAFIANLMDSGADFVACDFPQANRLTVHILAAVAEHEREMISQRTKAALAAAKARGVRLGGSRPGALQNADDGRRQGRAVRAAKVQKRVADLLPIIRGIQAEGITSLRQIAAALNGRGIPAMRGGQWSPVQVARLVRRLSSAQAFQYAT